MTFPVFASGDVLNASDMNAVGLWLVKTQTIGSGVSSVTVTGAFSADYDNYKITINGGSQSVSAGINLRMGTTATGYQYFGIYGATNSSAINALNSTTATSIVSAGRGGANGLCLNCDVFQPNAAARTIVMSRAMDPVSNSISVWMNGFLDDSTSYTSFTVVAELGTFTGGTIRVFGYRK